MQAPVRQVLIYDRNETVVMTSLDEMGEFVNDHIFDTVHGLLDEFEVQPNATSFLIAILLTRNSAA